MMKTLSSSAYFGYALQSYKYDVKYERKSTKAPTIKSTKAPTIKSSKAPTIRSTKAPTVPTVPTPTVPGPTPTAPPPTPAPVPVPTSFPSEEPTSAPTPAPTNPLGVFSTCNDEFEDEAFSSFSTATEIIGDDEFDKEEKVKFSNFDDDFEFSWNGVSFEKIFVTTHGVIFFDNEDSATKTNIEECNNADPILDDTIQTGNTGGTGASDDPDPCPDLPRIAVAHSSLATLDGTGGVYAFFDSTADGGAGALTISWENMGYTLDGDDPVGSSSFQATLYSGGALKYCYGPGDLSANYTAGVEDDPNAVFAPANAAVDGVTDVYPSENFCTCFRPLP